MEAHKNDAFQRHVCVPATAAPKGTKRPLAQKKRLTASCFHLSGVVRSCSHQLALIFKLCIPASCDHRRCELARCV
eukprot:1157570-Pelagomonas_calceolata.AAC.5